MFRWGDGLPTQIHPGLPTSVRHTFLAEGTYQVVMEIHHLPTDQIIGRTILSVEVKGASIQFVIAGTWNPLETPANGSYSFTDCLGGRTSAPGFGWDYVGFGCDVATDGTDGVLLLLLVPAGSAVVANQTFSKLAPGQPPSSGTFQVLMHQDLSDPANSTQSAIGTTGTVTIDAVDQLSDGTFVAHYSFSIGNGAGGTMVGSGIGIWK